MTLELETNDTDLTVSVVVKNTPAKPFHPNPALFERGVCGTETTTDGKGLGLYIVKEVAALHRGEVKADTTQNGLTRFTFVIPSEFSA